MQIPYRVIRSNRKTIAIQIKTDGQVLVRCPRQMRAGDIQEFVDSKMQWIENHLPGEERKNISPFSQQEIEMLRKQTNELVRERAAHYADVLGVSYNHITIRAQRTRWGSCSSKGNLNFNCLLALVPLEVLDYIVVHELCHLKHMNHSEHFWAEVARILPDYGQSKRWLRENGRLLIARI